MKKIMSILGDIILLAVILLCVLPFLYMILMSLKSTINAYDFSFSLSDITLKHYKNIFSNEVFIRYFVNSVLVSAAAVLLTLFTSCTAGYAFAKMNFKGNDNIFLMIILTMMVPMELILVPTYLIVRGFGWINTFQALILPLPSALGVFIMRQAIMGVPNELIESVKLDGGGHLQILRSVVLPIVKSAMLTLAIFTFLHAWNNFTWPLVVTTKDAMRTLPLALTTMKTQYDVDVGLTMACSAITFLPPFLFYILLQAKFEAGVALSGLKG